jgi:hypothetical protein
MSHFLASVSSVQNLTMHIYQKPLVVVGTVIGMKVSVTA